MEFKFDDILPFSYFSEYEERILDEGGFIKWRDGIIEAMSKPHVTPLEAIEFYVLVDYCLPQGWASDPEVDILSDGRILIIGHAD